MRESIAAVCLVIGSLSILLGGVSLLRMPDVYMRLSAASKAVSFGLAFCLIGMAVHFERVPVTMGAFATMGFVFLTVPIAAHMISRAAYRAGVALWSQTMIDELRRDLDREAETDESGSPPQN
jgi:multicomponent Na+:H+ antiporter subunit G